LDSSIFLMAVVYYIQRRNRINSVIEHSQRCTLICRPYNRQYPVGSNLVEGPCAQKGTCWSGNPGKSERRPPRAPMRLRHWCSGMWGGHRSSVVSLRSCGHSTSPWEKRLPMATSNPMCAKAPSGNSDCARPLVDGLPGTGSAAAQSPQAHPPERRLTRPSQLNTITRKSFDPPFSSLIAGSA